MTDFDAGSAPAETEDARPVSDEPKPGRAKETTYNGSVDPFAVAFNGAKDEIEAREAKSKPGPKPGAKKASEKPAAKATEAEADDGGDVKAKPKEASYAKSEDDDADAGDVVEKPKAKPEPKKTREPPKYWSEKRKEAFRFQLRETQDEWLTAEPEPNARWATDVREEFAKLPREAKEIILTRENEFEKGFSQKTQALAAERKLAEEVRAAVPAQMRTYMQQRGLSEPQVFHKLLGYQQQAMTDPVGYLRTFIAQNKINPLDIIPMDSGQYPNSPTSPAQVDVTSSPAYQALKAEFDTLQQSIAQDRAQRVQEEQKRFASEFSGIIQETDGDGNSLYPYVRILADPMAKIIEADPEHFSSLGVRERFSAAYALALEEFPELPSPKRTAKPRPVDEQDDEPAPAEPEDKRAAKLEKALTPKSRTPQTVPAKAKAADPLDEAIGWAMKKQQSSKR